MALDLSGLTLFVDECGVELIRKNIFQGESLFNIFPRWEFGVKTSRKIGLIDVSTNFIDCNCGWENAGNQAVSEREISATCIKTSDEICDMDLINYFTGKMIRIGAGKESLGELYEEFVDGILGSVRLNAENLVFRGDTSLADDNLNRFDGILKIVRDETPAGKKFQFNSGSVLSNLMSLDLYVTRTMKARGNVVMFVDPLIQGAAFNSAFNANLYHQPAGNSPDSFLRLPNGQLIRPVEGLRGTGAAILTPINNIVLSTDFMDDMESLDFWYSKDNQIWRYVIKFFLGVQVVLPDEVILAEFDLDYLYDSASNSINVNVTNDPLNVNQVNAASGAVAPVDSSVQSDVIAQVSNLANSVAALSGFVENMSQRVNSQNAPAAPATANPQPVAGASNPAENTENAPAAPRRGRRPAQPNAEGADSTNEQTE